MVTPFETKTAEPGQPLEAAITNQGTFGGAMLDVGNITRNAAGYITEITRGVWTDASTFSLRWKEIYTYDAENVLLEEKIENAAAETIAERVIGYDENGNWINSKPKTF